MPVDIVCLGKTWAVYSPSAYDGCDYNGEPMFKAEDSDDCWDYCDRKGYSARVRKRAILVNPDFLRDVEKRADETVAQLNDLGFTVESDVIYKASAAWKENPIHYAYSGDFGGRARLMEAHSQCDKARGLALMHRLTGMADALWELGLTLTFDKDGKHTVLGKYPQWVTIDADDL